MEHEEVVDRCYRFIRHIGIEIKESALAAKTFVPGVSIVEGGLVVDRQLLKYPGDLLHEAGHIALTHPAERKRLNGDATSEGAENVGYELGVLLWSFFAAREAGIPPNVVFHPDGYKGDSQWLIENFMTKKYVGLPLLKWMQMVEEDKEGEIKVTSWMRQ